MNRNQELPGAPATDEDFLKAQFERIHRVLRGTTLEKVRDAVRDFGDGGDLALEHAIDQAERYGAESFGYILRVMADSKAKGVPLKIALPAKASVSPSLAESPSTEREPVTEAQVSILIEQATGGGVEAWAASATSS